MTIKYPRILVGITATGIPTRTGATGEVALGSSRTLDVPSGANVLYSLVLSGITNTAQPVLTINTGTVVENGATSIDESVTFEGRPPGLTGNIRAILIERIDEGFLAAIVATGAGGNVWKIAGGGFVLIGNSMNVVAGVPDATLTLAMSSAAEPGTVRITVLGY